MIQLQTELYSADSEQIISDIKPNFYNIIFNLPINKPENPEFLVDNVATNSYSVSWGYSGWSKKFSYLLSKLNLELSHGFRLNGVDFSTYSSIEILDFLSNLTELVFGKTIPLFAFYL
ncbi:hypothetical protein AYI69_g1346 [Smittium culicis]|uniref:Uncharacterized protein n=1 Tax=Smittium culicis TaxID=133412 RepID=A0A1R1YQW2_9FUNG|nr:hypothetical protein AYI69_g1346 [Smittium culicis]